jgi:hypothetical protein
MWDPRVRDRSVGGTFCAPRFRFRWAGCGVRPTDTQTGVESLPVVGFFCAGGNGVRPRSDPLVARLTDTTSAEPTTHCATDIYLSARHKGLWNKEQR